MQFHGIGGELAGWNASITKDARDWVTRRNDGTFDGGMGIVAAPGKGGTHAFSFDGSNDSIILPDGVDVSPGAGNYSITAWVLIDNTGTGRRIYENVGVASSHYVLMQTQTGGKVQASFSGSGGTNTVTATNAFVTGVWYHVAAVREGGTVRLYIDGVLDVTNSATNPGTITAEGGSASRIGRYAASPAIYWDGLIDDLRLFKHALTQEQITDLASSRTFQRQLPVGIGGEVGWWVPSLDPYPGSNRLLDLSGYGNNGTLTNMDPATDWVSETSHGGVRVLDLDVTNDEVRTSITHPAATAFGFSVWCKPQFGTGNPGFWRSGGTYCITQLVSENRPWVNVNSVTILKPLSGETIVAGVWQHLFYKITANSVEFWKNGVLAHSASHSTAIPEFTIPGFGWQSNTGVSSTEKVGGLWDDIRFFSRNVSSSEIQALASKRGYQPTRRSGIGDEAGWWVPSLDPFPGTPHLRDLKAKGTKNTGTLTGMDPATDWVEDTDAGGSQALDFDGVDDYVSLGIKAADSVSLTGSFSAWIKCDGTQQGTIVAVGNTNIQTGFFRVVVNMNPSTEALAAGRIQVFLRTPSSLNLSGGPLTDTGIADGNWHHLACNWNKGAGTIQIYIDTVAVTISYRDTSTNTNPITWDAPLTLGVLLYNGLNSPFKGKIEDARVLSRNLAGPEIRALYAEGQGRGREIEYPVGLGDEMAWYCPGLAPGIDTANVFDLTGITNHGTLINGSTNVEDISNGGTRAYDCSSGEISVPHQSMFELPTTGSVAFWVKLYVLSQGESDYVVGKQINSNPAVVPGWGVGFYGKDSGGVNRQLRVVINGITYDGTTEGIALNTWHHVQVVWNGATIKFWLNGQLDATRTQTSTVPTGSYPLRIGYSTNCSVDDIRITAAQWGSAEAATLYRQGQGRGSTISYPTKLSTESGWWSPTHDPGYGGSGLLDLSQSYRHGTLINMDPATDWVDDISYIGAKALDLDGLDDHVVLANSQELIQRYPFTVMGWIKPRTLTQYDGILSNTDHASLPFTIRANAASQLEVLYNNTLILTSTTITLNTWTHFALVSTAANNHKLYTDGSEVATSATSVTPISTDSPLRIGVEGAVASAQIFDGLIDNFQMWQSAATPAQIKQKTWSRDDTLSPHIATSAAEAKYPETWTGLVRCWDSRPRKTDRSMTDYSTNGARHTISGSQWSTYEGEHCWNTDLGPSNAPNIIAGGVTFCIWRPTGNGSAFTQVFRLNNRLYLDRLNGFTDTGVSLPVNTIHRVACDFSDGANVDVWLNGSVVYSAPLSSPASTSNFRLGARYDGATDLVGQLFAVVMWQTSSPAFDLSRLTSEPDYYPLTVPDAEPPPSAVIHTRRRRENLAGGTL